MNAWKKWDRFLSWFSWLVLGAEVAYVIARIALPEETVAAIDGYAGWFMPVLLAGAVGYITNWLALWYLFKPYEPHCGGRVQGIIPKRKREMAVSLGNMVGQIRELKVRGKRFVATYLREKVPELIDRAFASEMLREKLEKGILPKVGVKVAQLIGENKQAILDKLRLERRVTEAVDGMSVATFHQTLNEFMAENFCAVQVLGFVLGALVGALQLLART